MKTLILLLLLITTTTQSQSYTIEKGQIGITKIKFIDSCIDVNDNHVIVDTQLKYQKTRQKTVYNIINREKGNDFIYYELNFTDVGSDNYVNKMYLYKDKIIIIIIDTMINQSYITVYNIN